jgi:hypothetical protein
VIKLLKVILTVTIAATVIIGYRWHQYVTNTDSPFDEVGIALNRHMPYPINLRGCEMLRTNFGTGLPPLGCAAGDGKQWK